MFIIFINKRFSNDLEVKSLKLYLLHFDYTVHFYFNSEISQPHLILKDTSYKHRIILRAYELTKIANETKIIHFSKILF